MASNEELCGMIQAGDAARLLDLWENNRGIIRKLARRHAPQFGALSVEDLEQVGYVALHRAAYAWDSASGARFISYLVPCLHGQMLRALGWKRDGLPPAVASTNAPVSDEEDGNTPLDLLPDEAAIDPLEAAQRGDVPGALRDALDRLPQEQRRAVTDYALARSVPLEAVRRDYERGIRRLRTDTRLRRALEGYIDPVYWHVGAKAFRNGASSSVERAVLMRERFREDWDAFEGRLAIMRAQIEEAHARAGVH